MKHIFLRGCFKKKCVYKWDTYCLRNSLADCSKSNKKNGIILTPEIFDSIINNKKIKILKKIQEEIV